MHEDLHPQLREYYLELDPAARQKLLAACDEDPDIRGTAYGPAAGSGHVSPRTDTDTETDTAMRHLYGAAGSYASKLLGLAAYGI